MVDIAEAMQIAEATGFSPEISDAFLIDGAVVYGHIEDGFFREQNSVGSVAFRIRLRRKEFAGEPPVGKAVVYQGIEYRIDNGSYPSGGDWIIPLVRGYVQA